MGFFKKFRRTLGKGITGIGKARTFVGGVAKATGLPVVSQLGEAAEAIGKFEQRAGRVVGGKEKFSSKLVGEAIGAGVKTGTAIAEVAPML